MADYKIQFRASVFKDLEKLPKSDVRRIMKRIKGLEQNPRPHGCEKLTGGERYRIRQGKFRIVYSIQDDILTVWVVKVGHRRDVYR